MQQPLIRRQCDPSPTGVISDEIAWAGGGDRIMLDIWTSLVRPVRIVCVAWFTSEALYIPLFQFGNQSIRVLTIAQLAEHLTVEHTAEIRVSLVRFRVVRANCTWMDKIFCICIIGLFLIKKLIFCLSESTPSCWMAATSMKQIRIAIASVNNSLLSLSTLSRLN